MAIGQKEAQIRDLRASRARRMLIDDGLPEKFVRTSAPKRAPEKKDDDGVTLAPPPEAKKATAGDAAGGPKQAPEHPAPTQESELKKPKKAAAKKAPAKKAKTAAKPRRQTKGAAKKKGVPAQLIADFVCRPGGASMDELTKEFGIEAHPMRAKIFYVKHTLGYVVDHKDGRYHGTAPAAKT